MIRDRRRQIIDYSIIGIVLVLIAVLFWPSFGDDDDLDPAREEMAEEVATPTPDPEEPPVPEPTADTTPASEEEVSSLCVPGDATQVLANFVQRFNDGDLEALAEMLPSTGSESPRTSSFPGMDQHVLHSFKHHESGSMSHRYEVIDFLAQRHRAGEFWRLKEYRLSRMYRNPNAGNPELDEAFAVIQRSSDEFHTHEVSGQAVINCVEGLVILWDFSTDEPDLAVPIKVGAFLGAVGPYGIAEMRNLRMIVSTDLRPDGGTLTEWDIRRDEANSVAGLYVERVTVDSLSGERLVSYVYDGEGWYMNQRGWEATGDLTGPTVLPLEIMLTRREPSVTADLIRAHRDEIPEEGTHVISKDFVISPELREAFALVDGAGDVQGLMEVEIQDGAIVRTRYRLIGESGLHFAAPEIRWIEIVRADRFDSTLFHLPQGYLTVGQQYEIPETLADQMTFLGDTEHSEGISELFELNWEGTLIDVKVMPSRGGVESSARGDNWDPFWRSTQVYIDSFPVMIAEMSDRDYPTNALWDTGEYRFELSVSAEADVDPEQWSMDQLRAVVETLSLQADGDEV